ncbi:MAG: RnfABCDGE type electron transport complex subunit G [Eubacterium sp.]|nr:RnfABCDGE type electron transport complex subunit G [Eubacterium sp.]
MKKQKDDIVKNTVFLLVLTLILGAILGSVYFVTKEPIAKQDKIKHDAALEDVFKDAAEFQEVEITEDLAQELRNSLDGAGLAKQTVDEVNSALDASGAELGNVYSVTSSEGYGGDIKFTVGIDNDGTILGISYLSIEETAGLGMRATTDDFKAQFTGKQVPEIKYSKTGASADDEIDALSGSTVTTNAVVNGVNAALLANQIIMEGGAS